ncbi:MAG: helix-turn-helix transcriptional regulator [Oscillospiraceae bacterium]|nr:helix-turn-helix transcriptional regulator [Oscillospiraceae bacterium]
MTRLLNLFNAKGAKAPIIDQNLSQNEKSSRLAALSIDERAAYKWLYEGYSEPWTMETLGLKKNAAKRLFRSVYRKLGVENQRGLIQHYALQELEFM